MNDSNIPKSAQDVRDIEARRQRAEDALPVQVLRAHIDNDFMYHQPKPGQPEKYNVIRNTARLFAHLLVDSCPVSRELSTALTKLEECVMHANAGIARHG